MMLYQRTVQENVGRNVMKDLPDGLHLALCGTGSPFPDPTRTGPCSAITSGTFIAGSRWSMARVKRVIGRTT